MQHSELILYIHKVCILLTFMITATCVNCHCSQSDAVNVLSCELGARVQACAGSKAWIDMLLMLRVTETRTLCYWYYCLFLTNQG